MDAETKCKLAKRATELVRTAWTKGAYERDGKHCLYGCYMQALDDVIGSSAQRFGALQYEEFDVNAEIKKVAPDIRNIEGWNDRPERTHEEVIAVAEKVEANVCAELPPIEQAIL